MPTKPPRKETADSSANVEPRIEAATPAVPLWKKPVLTILEAQAYGPLSRSKLYELIRTRLLKSHVVGGRRVIDRAHFDAVLRGE